MTDSDALTGRRREALDAALAAYQRYPSHFGPNPASPSLFTSAEDFAFACAWGTKVTRAVADEVAVEAAAMFRR